MVLMVGKGSGDGKDWQTRGLGSSGKSAPGTVGRRAREQQKQVEQARLMAHQRVAIELLADPKERRRLLTLARGEVQRWRDQALCSDDYIQRWTEWLALPVADLARRMCSDAGGWGTAMRQNSPFAVLGR